MVTVLFYFWLFAMPALGLVAFLRGVFVRSPGSRTFLALGLTMIAASLAGWSTLAAGLCESGQDCGDSDTAQTVLWVTSALLAAVTIGAGVQWRRRRRA